MKVWPRSSLPLLFRPEAQVELAPLDDVLYGDADCRLIGRRSLFSKVTISLYRGDETQAISLSIMHHDAKAAA